MLCFVFCNIKGWSPTNSFSSFTLTKRLPYFALIIQTILLSFPHGKADSIKYTSTIFLQQSTLWEQAFLGKVHVKAVGWGDVNRWGTSMVPHLFCVLSLPLWVWIWCSSEVPVSKWKRLFPSLLQPEEKDGRGDIPTIVLGLGRVPAMKETFLDETLQYWEWCWRLILQHPMEMP